MSAETDRARLLEQCAKIAESPYSDAVEAFGSDEPLAVGAKIAKAIRRLVRRAAAPAEEPQP